MIIDSFTGSYFFLSNFSESKIILLGKVYPTNEHAYQAAKFFLSTEKNNKIRELIRLAKTPADAKRLGRKYAITTPNWEYQKCIVMMELLRRKFSIPELKEKLIETKNFELVEGNWWKDTYWGKYNGSGLNMLGKMLMFIRKEVNIGSIKQCPLCSGYTYLCRGGVTCVNGHGGVISDSWFMSN